MTTKLIPIEHLLETGLLFEINRRILYPFGLAISLNVDDRLEKVLSIDLLENDDPEGFIFDEATFLECEIKFKDFMESYGKLRLSIRKSLIGFEEQISADQSSVPFED